MDAQRSVSFRRKGAHGRSERLSRRGHQAKAQRIKTAAGQLGFGGMCSEDKDVVGVELEETGRSTS